MSESAEEKRKRRLINNLKKYQWKYQYSIYPAPLNSDKSEDEAIAKFALLEHDRILRRKLGEQFPDTAIMFEFRRMLVPRKIWTLYKGDQIYITLHTSKELDKTKLGDLVKWVYPEDAKLNSRPVTNERIEENINSIKKQRLHSQITRDNGTRVNRFSMINEEHLIPVSVV